MGGRWTAERQWGGVLERGAARSTPGATGVQIGPPFLGTVRQASSLCAERRLPFERYQSLDRVRDPFLLPLQAAKRRS